MQLTKENRGECSILLVHGRLDGTTSPKFETEVLAWLSVGGKAFVLDMAGISFMSSAALRVLLTMAKRVGRLGGKIVLSSPNAVVAEVFEISNFSTMFTICPTLDEGVAAATKGLEKSGPVTAAPPAAEARPADPAPKPVPAPAPVATAPPPAAVAPKPVAAPAPVVAEKPVPLAAPAPIPAAAAPPPAAVAPTPPIPPAPAPAPAASPVSTPPATAAPPSPAVAAPTAAPPTPAVVTPALPVLKAAPPQSPSPASPLPPKVEAPAAPKPPSVSSPQPPSPPAPANTAPAPPPIEPRATVPTAPPAVAPAVAASASAPTPPPILPAEAKPAAAPSPAPAPAPVAPKAGPKKLEIVVGTHVVECHDGDVIGSEGTVAHHLFKSATALQPRHVLIGKGPEGWFIMMPRNVQVVTHLDNAVLAPGVRQNLSGEHRLTVAELVISLRLSDAPPTSINVNDSFFTKLMKMLNLG